MLNSFIKNLQQCYIVYKELHCVQRVKYMYNKTVQKTKGSKKQRLENASTMTRRKKHLRTQQLYL